MFQDLRREVDEHLARNPHLMRRALWTLRLKTAVGVVVLASSWYQLSFRHGSTPTIVGAVGGLCVGVAILAVNILHDASHGATFASRRANRAVGWLADALLGFDTYAWRFKHNVTHHTYPNVDGFDDDISQQPILRIAATQPHRSWYRFQHLYVWPAYGLSVIRWHLTDLVNLWRKNMGGYEYKSARGLSLWAALSGKIFFWACAFYIPWHYGHHSWWQVLVVYLTVVSVVSVILVTIFQLAHVVDEADFVTLDELVDSPTEWAELQVASTVDFARESRVVAAVLGGLNLQVEHHLFPRLPHTLYPHLREPIDRALGEHGLRVKVHGGFGAALRAHYQHLKLMGAAGLPVDIEMG